MVLDPDGPGPFELRILDDGPGVPEGELGALTFPGVRGGAARTRHPHGRGLGLAIAARVCKLHGLTLTIENRSEGGLVATLRGAAGAAIADDGGASRSP